MNLVAGIATVIDPYTRLMELFNLEQNMLKTLHEQIQRLESRLKCLESQFHELCATVPNRSHKEQHLSNPLNTLTLVRRLTSDWTVLINLATDSSIMSLTDVKWPSGNDLKFVARTIARLQFTYNLTTEDLANGKIYNISAIVNITATDCVNMARYYYDQHQHSQAAEWLEQALTKHDKTLPAAAILELTVLSKCFSGDSMGSVSALKILLKDFPTHELSQSLLSDWELAASGDCQDIKLLMEERHEKTSLSPPKSFELYNWLCRGGSTAQPGLRCRYVHYNKTYLRLAPFFMEELQLEPPVLKFYNVVSDAEIQEVKRLALPQLKTSLVVDPKGSQIHTAHRTSESVFIGTGQSNIMDKLTKRMADMTSLDTLMAEDHQVSRYGGGGEYLFHVDAFGSKKKFKYYGDRIVTLMFYLSDVRQGGHTVFRNWRLSVKPQKGSAILWFNLYRNGTDNLSTWHGGCPVLEGTKLVLNKWFREMSSDYRTSCLLDPTASFKYFYI